MFTHLHLHTDYSLLDGLSRIPQLMERARELGQEAIALTDHGVLYGAVEFYKEAKTWGIKPIIGVEAYVAPASRFSREMADRQPYHLTLLCRDRQGYQNLLALTTKAHLEGYYYKPRMDKELLAQHGRGIIALSGCQTSEIARLLAEDRWEEAAAAARWYREVFDGFYLELQEHNLAELTALNRKLMRLSRETGIPLVATNDVHYIRREDAPIHDVLLCIGTNSTVLDQRRLRMSDDSYYLKSEEEMRQLFADVPEAVDNSWRIAEECDLELEFGLLHLPEADVPAGLSPDDYLAQLCHQALPRRYPQISDEVRRRLDYELEVVRQTGFANYILVVWDFARFAQSRGILMGVRGSAAASIILYLLGITDIDPLRYRLVFERFLNVERREMPDIDMDFADDRRDEVIRYVAEKYGHDRVAQIITFGTMGAKAAIRDVGRALGMSYGQADRVARLIPNLPPSAGVVTIDRALAEGSELKRLYDEDEDVRRLVDTARSLEGVARHASTHAAGVVIAPGPLVQYLPLQRPVRGGEDAIPMTQYAMEAVADLGLLKMDFLGLANLTILGRAVELVRQTRGQVIDLHQLPDGDPATYRMLSAGETFGVFQLESAGMRRYIQELKPSGIADLAAMVALYRPGPMQHIATYIEAKHGRQAIHYPHPHLADILDETYGVIVYQDQVLLIAQRFAGYTLGQADVMRKAMGKKIPEVMRAERERFIAGAVAKGYSVQQAEEVFDLIEPFAGYAFNKAHAVCYATIAYQTAYLKANYPVEYMAAVLAHAQDHPQGTERIGAAVNECARLGIQVLPPDVNKSQVNFGVEEREDGPPAIRFGLATIKNVGHAAAEAIIEARQRGGAFTSAEDFCRRIDLGRVNRRALESIIKAGALDALAPRGALLAALDRLLAMAQREQRLRRSGQASMFDLFGQQVPIPASSLSLEEVELPATQMLLWEKELLGVYLSQHSFTRAVADLGSHVTAMCSEVTAEMAGREVVLAGIVAGIRQLTTRDGRPFCAAVIEDLSGSLEVTAWPDVYESTRELWALGNILLLSVRVRSRGERLNVSVQRVEPYQAQDRLEEAQSLTPEVAEPPLDLQPSPGDNGARPSPPHMRLRITMAETEDEEADRRRLEAVMDVLRRFPGGDEVCLVVHTVSGDEVELALPAAHLCPELCAQLEEVLADAGAVRQEAV